MDYPYFERLVNHKTVVLGLPTAFLATGSRMDNLFDSRLIYETTTQIALVDISGRAYSIEVSLAGLLFRCSNQYSCDNAFRLNKNSYVKG